MFFATCDQPWLIVLRKIGEDRFVDRHYYANSPPAVIDDKLPYHPDGSLMCMSVLSQNDEGCFQPQNIWPSILEKGVRVPLIALKPKLTHITVLST